MFAHKCWWPPLLHGAPFIFPLLLLGLLGGTACSGLTDGGSYGQSVRVQVDRSDSMIVVKNQGPDTVWTAQYGRSVLARILWRPTLTAPSVTPGSEWTVPLREVPMDETENQVVVFWWGAVGRGADRTPGDISSETVDL